MIHRYGYVDFELKIEDKNKNGLLVFNQQAGISI